MKTMQVRSHIGADGILELKLPSGVTETDVDVVVVVQPVRKAQDQSEAERRQWEQFIRETAGSITDPTFFRHEQGEFEKREELA